MAFKSFYDLTNSSALSAKELFKYRLKRDNTVPSRGGQKDFEPDGSWMQSKGLEVFLQEWTSVINEPRVERLRNLVQGDWDESNRLVNVDKPGKFWAHMGFTDKRRNWLYPEEALFLIEINALEVHHKGVSMSVQQAYDTFLGTNVTLPQYQVFAHLRRLGYVVLRHETAEVITNYERKMNLDKYMTKKQIKKRKNDAKDCTTDKDSDALTTEDTANTVDDSIDTSYESDGSNNVKSPEKNKSDISNMENSLEETSATDNTSKCDASENITDDSEKSTKRSRNELDDDSESCDSKRHCPDSLSAADDQSSESSSPSRMFYATDVWSECFTPDNSTTTDVDKSERHICLRQTPWQESSCNFPDIGGNEFLQLTRPDDKLLPKNIELGEDENLFCFDVQDYRLKLPQRNLSQRLQREDEEEARVEGLDFSFAEWVRRRPVVKSSNWVEHKKKVTAYWEEMTDSTPVSHLWKGEVTPLVTPLDAWTTGSILQKLDIIKSADDSTLKANKDVTKTTPLSFDVHLPDKSFKKSMPGKPDHRVLVTKSMRQPPELCHLAALSQSDGVPVHWAVVDAGEIAFYAFDMSHKLDTLT